MLDLKEVFVLPFLVLLIALAAHDPSLVVHEDSRTALAVSAVVIVVWCAAALWCPGWHDTTSRRVRCGRDLAGVALCLLLYPSLRWAVPAVHPARYDAVLARADRWLFGGRDPLLLIEHLVHPELTAMLGLAYFCAWVPPVALGLLLYVRHRDGELSDLLLGLVLVHCVGFLGYFLVPAVGPWYGLADQFRVSLSDNWLVAHYLAHNNNVDAFPSLHIAATALVGVFTWRDCRPLFWLTLPLLLAIGVATMYLRWHYVVDVLAGLLLAAAVRLLVPRLNAAWPRLRARARYERAGGTGNRCGADAVSPSPQNSR
ncbi:phosphatase PAP2 family protein [Streptomyces sp. NPDC006627]|uniref:phosphatase PAP2 family protein n=1 Tax=Streptomyces sp. NPDC006627 TaxID=3154679 RepID=UPI0033B5DE6C